MSLATAQKHEIAWAAGLFEGEGSVGCWGKKKSTRAVMATTDLDVLQKYVSVIGIGKISGPFPLRKGTFAKKDQWRWTASGYRNVQAICAAFWHWLGDRRKEQVRKTLVGAVTQSSGRYLRLREACSQGHKFDELNTYINPTSKSRTCKTCRDKYMKKYHLDRSANVPR